MEPQDSQKPETSKAKGYGRRPIWQWVIIYLILAIIVYGLIYLIFIHKSGGTSAY